MNSSSNQPSDKKAIAELHVERMSEEKFEASKVWARFRRHPGAVAGSIVLFLLIIAVLLAPLSMPDPRCGR